MFSQLLNIDSKEQHSCSEEIWKEFFPFFLCGKVVEYLTVQENIQVIFAVGGVMGAV